MIDTQGSSTQTEQHQLHKLAATVCMFTVPFHFPFHRSVPCSIPVIRDAHVHLAGCHMDDTVLSQNVKELNTSTDNGYQALFSSIPGGLENEIMQKHNFCFDLHGLAMTGLNVTMHLSDLIALSFAVCLQQL